MKNFLSNPNWQGIGAVAAILAVIVAISGLIYVGRPTKSLRVQILANSPLVSVNGEVGKDIQVLYKDKPVQDLSLILLRIENTGNQPILGTDYSEPLRFTFGPNTQIGDVVVQESTPANIPLIMTVDNNQIEVSKTLLNPGDQVVIKVLSLNNNGTMNVTARIVGISNVEVASTLTAATAIATFFNGLFVSVISTALAVLTLVIAGLVQLRTMTKKLNKDTDKFQEQSRIVFEDHDKRMDNILNDIHEHNENLIEQNKRILAIKAEIDAQLEKGSESQSH